LLPGGTGIENNTKYAGIVVARVHGIAIFWTRNEISKTGGVDLTWRGGEDEVEDMDGGCSVGKQVWDRSSRVGDSVEDREGKGGDDVCWIEGGDGGRQLER